MNLVGDGLPSPSLRSPQKDPEAPHSAPPVTERLLPRNGPDQFPPLKIWSGPPRSGRGDETARPLANSLLSRWWLNGGGQLVAHSKRAPAEASALLSPASRWRLTSSEYTSWPRHPTCRQPCRN